MSFICDLMRGVGETAADRERTLAVTDGRQTDGGSVRVARDVLLSLGAVQIGSRRSQVHRGSQSEAIRLASFARRERRQCHYLDTPIRGIPDFTQLRGKLHCRESIGSPRLINGIRSTAKVIANVIRISSLVFSRNTKVP